MTKQQSFNTSKEIDSIVVIPALNEADHIGAVLTALSRDIGAKARFELWVVDGGSDDGTQGIVEQYALSDPKVSLLHNPDRTQSCALNMAAQEARRRGGIRYLIRADAHSVYPQKWVSQLIKTVEEEGADSVVVPMRTRGGGAMRNAAADLFNSWLGNGGSPHRTGKTRGFVEHGHHALFRLDVFLEAGGYDPSFLANEDAELDLRLHELGRRVFLENAAVIEYIPRGSLGGVIRQFHRNGRFRVHTSRKHGSSLGLRQLAPMGLVVLLMASLIASLVVHPVLSAPAVVYVAAVLAASCSVATKKAPRRIGLIFAQAVAAHLAFGFGVLRAQFEYLISRAALTPESGSQPRNQAQHTFR